MKKTKSLRVIACAAVCAALSIVLGKFAAIPIGNTIRISFENLPIIFCSVAFGPAVGGACGAVADLLGCLLRGYDINPLITLGAGSIGLTAGLLWRALPNLRLGLRTQISVFAGHAVGSIVINSLALHLFYNYPWSVLVTRIPNALVLAAVNTVLVRLLLENKTIRGIAQ